MGFHQGRFVLIQGVEGVSREELFDLSAIQLLLHLLTDTAKVAVIGPFLLIAMYRAL